MRKFTFNLFGAKFTMKNDKPADIYALVRLLKQIDPLFYGLPKNQDSEAAWL